MTDQLALPKRSLGKTGIMITPIGFGAMELSGGGGGLLGFAFPQISPADKNAIVKAALDSGINYFDTAEFYGNGVSEQALSTALKAAGKKDEDVVIATKWWPILRTASNIPVTIQDRIRYLDGYTISLYMVHQPYGLSSPEAEMDAMAKLAAAGKVRSVGVSNFNAERMRRAYDELQKHGLPLAANQMKYSLLDRKTERDGTLAAAKELGITITAYTPLASGLLTGKYHKNPELLQKLPAYRRAGMQRNLERTRPLIEAMEQIAAKYSATVAQVALNWIVTFNGDTVVTIPGATKVHQAEQNAGAMKFKLTPDELARIDELSHSLS
jgi:Predicted oxidoreductases (related to aryl-alcohol dehydrogenases)